MWHRARQWHRTRAWYRAYVCRAMQVWRDDSRLGWVTIGAGLLAFLAYWITHAAWAIGVRVLGQALGVPEVMTGTLSRAGGTGLAIAVSAFAARVVWGGNMASLGLNLHRRWQGDLVYGAVLTGVAMLVLFAVLIRGGWLVVLDWRWQTMRFRPWLSVLWISFLTSAQAAIGEEAMFRGFLLNGLRRAWGPTRGLMVTSVLFAVPHLLNRSAAQTALPLFIFALLGPALLLGWTYLNAGSLWLPVGIHFAWNFVQNGLLNLPARVGQNVFGAETLLTGPAWLVGTAYGVEVGLLSLIPLGIVALGSLAWLRFLRR